MKRVYYPQAICYVCCILLLTVLTTAAIASEVPVDLGSAAKFAVLAGSTVTNGAVVGTIITGDLGVSPGTAVTGFPPGVMVGTTYAGGPVAAQAQLDLTAAYNDAAGRSTSPVSVAGNLGGQTLYAGLYKSTGSLEISSGDLVLDASGDPNAVFIFQMETTLTTTSGRQITLAGCAQPSNIFWQVGSSATFGTTTVFYGTVMAAASITFNSGVTLIGRALAQTGAITLDTSVITVPPMDAPLDISQSFSTPDWQFNQNCNAEGWINNADLTSLSVTDGILSTSTLGLNPQMISQRGLDINADYQTEVKIRMRVNAGTQGAFSFRSPSDVGFNPTKKILFTIPNNSSFVTYSLDLKKALGWTGAIDQLRFNPSNLSGADVEIDYFSVCLPVVIKAPCWEFENDGDIEGWTANAQIPGATATGGLLVGTTTGTSARLLSPSNFTAKASLQNRLVIRMKVTSGNSFQVQFKRSIDGTFLAANAKNVPVTNHIDFVNYVIDLSTKPTYTGTITQFAVKPSTASGAAVSIEYIRLCEPTYVFAHSSMFNTNGNAEGWIAGANSSPLVVSNGYLKSTSTGTDPKLISPALTVDTRFSRFFMGALQISSGSFFELYYRQFGDAGFTSVKKKRRNLFANSGQRLYSVDLGTLANYEADDIKRLRIDPASASGVNTKIDFMGMLNQTMEIGYASEFNVPGNAEGWLANADLTLPIVALGVLSASSTGTDPFLLSPTNLFINADNEKQVVVRMKVSAGNMGRLFYRRSTDPGFALLRSKTFTISSNTDFVTYNIDMSADPNWSGLVNRLRFDPTVANGASVKLDLLETYGPVQTGTPEWRWAEDGNALGWTAGSNVASLAVAGSILTVTSSGADPDILSTAGLGINAASQEWVIMRMKVSSAPGDPIDLYYKRTTDGGFSSVRKASLIVPNNTDYVTYKINMAADPNWTGTIDSFRLNPSPLASSVSKLDYILVP